MSFRLARDEPVPAGVRRIVDEQVGRAIDELGDREVDRHEAVHQARKRLKRVRAVLRLARAELGEAYGRENRWYRDTGRGLSRLRDAGAMVEACDKLAGAEPDAGSVLGPLREALVARRERFVEEEVDLEDRVDSALERLREARDRIGDWPLELGGWTALEPGLRRTYRRGRRAMAGACGELADERFHEWRKRVKYHWYHARLLRDLWPEVMEAWVAALKRLSDRLGDDHDLVVLRGLLVSEEALARLPVAGEAGRLAERRQAMLRAEAEGLGARIYAEAPKAMSARCRAYWEAWRRDGQ